MIPSMDPKAGGPVNGVRNTTPLLIENGWDVDILTFGGYQNVDYDVFSFPANTVYSYNSDFQNWLYQNVSAYDLVIIHGIWQFHSFSAYRACKKYSVPYLLFTHGMLDPWFNKDLLKKIKKSVYWHLIEKRVVNNASYTLFTSEEERVLARDSFGGYNPNERVLAYGSSSIDISYDAAEQYVSENFPYLLDSKYLLYLSRIHEKKGVDLLIKAYAAAGLSDLGIALVIAGPGDENYLESLKALAYSLGVSSSIYWPGMLQGDAKDSLFKLADAFVLPSHQENFGIVVAESLSAETPVLITNKVNIWTEITTAKSGLVCDDTVASVECMLKEWALKSEKDKVLYKSRARKCFEEKFSIDKAVESLEDTINQVLMNAKVR